MGRLGLPPTLTFCRQTCRSLLTHVIIAPPLPSATISILSVCTRPPPSSMPLVPGFARKPEWSTCTTRGPEEDTKATYAPPALSDAMDNETISSGDSPTSVLTAIPPEPPAGTPVLSMRCTNTLITDEGAASAAHHATMAPPLPSAMISGSC